MHWVWGILFVTGAAFAQDYTSHHFLMETRDKKSVAEDLLRERVRHQQKADETYRRLLTSGEGAVPMKNIRQAKSESEKAALALVLAEKEYEALSLEEKVWAKRSVDPSDTPELRVFYQDLWNKRAEAFTLHSKIAEVEWEYLKQRYEKLVELAKSNAIPQREVFEVFHRMKDAEGDRDLFLKRAADARNAAESFRPKP